MGNYDIRKLESLFTRYIVYHLSDPLAAFFTYEEARDFILRKLGKAS